LDTVNDEIYDLRIGVYEHNSDTVTHAVKCYENGEPVIVTQEITQSFSNITYNIETFDVNIKEDICIFLCYNNYVADLCV